jgi:MoaA/NifB/PqqE/SkfB family radical SAM enzyme
MSGPNPSNRFVSFNLEPTFRCNLECEMCPRFSSVDPHLDMSMET